MATSHHGDTVGRGLVRRLILAGVAMVLGAAATLAWVQLRDDGRIAPVPVSEQALTGLCGSVQSVVTDWYASVPLAAVDADDPMLPAGWEPAAAGATASCAGVLYRGTTTLTVAVFERDDTTDARAVTEQAVRGQLALTVDDPTAEFSARGDGTMRRAAGVTTVWMPVGRYAVVVESSDARVPGDVVDVLAALIGDPVSDPASGPVGGPPS